MTWILFFLLHAYAQDSNQTPCNKAVQDFKTKCARFVFQFAPQLDQGEPDLKRCEKIRQVSQESEKKFKEVCGGQAESATQKCRETASGGITGGSGSTSMTEDLEDLNHMLKWFHDEFMKNIKNSNCPEPAVS